MAHRLFQYQILAEPTNQSPETTSLDRWVPDTEPPPTRRKVKAGAAIAAMAAGMFFNPITQPNPQDTVAHSQHVSVVHDRVVQYQAMAMPVGEITPDEVRTIDKWSGIYPVKIFDKKRNQYTYPAFTTDPTQLLQREAISADRWVQPQSIPTRNWKQESRYPLNIDQFDFNFIQQPDPHNAAISASDTTITYSKTVQYKAYTSPVDDPIEQSPTEVDTWFVNTSVPRFDKERNQHLYPTLFDNTIGQPSPQEVSIAINSDLVIFPREIIYQSLTKPTYVEEVVPTLLPDATNPAPAIPLFDKQRQQYAYPTFFVDNENLTDAETLYPDKWVGYHPDIIFDRARNQHLYPVVAYDTYQLTQPENPSIDKWIGSKPDKIFDKSRNQYLYPTWTGLEEEPADEIEIESWFVNTATPRFDQPRNQHLYPSEHKDVYSVTLAEANQIDKWLPQIPDIIFDRERRQFTYPTYWANHEPIAETDFFIDKWNGIYPAVIFDRARNQYLYPALSEDLTRLAEEEAPVDFLFQEDVQVVRNRKAYFRTLYYPAYSDEPGVIYVHCPPLTDWNNVSAPTTGWSWNRYADTADTYNDPDIEYNDVDVYYNGYDASLVDHHNPVDVDWSPAGILTTDWTYSQPINDSLNAYDDPGLDYDSEEYYDSYDPATTATNNAIDTDWSNTSSPPSTAWDACGGSEG